MDNQKTLWLQQLIRYFLLSKGYTQVRFLTGQKETEELDVWMINTESPFMIVHVVCGHYTGDNPAFNMQSNAIMNAAKMKGRILEIYLSENATDLNYGDTRIINLYPGRELPQDIAELFPEISTVIFNTENPEEAKKQIKKELFQHALDVGDSQKKTHAPQLEVSKIYLVILVICVIITAAINILKATRSYDEVALAIVFGAYYKGFVNYFNDFWRFLTAGFVHVSILHLICNMAALFNTYVFVEKRYGKLQTLAILLFAITIGNGCVYIGNGITVALGISGGIYGIFAAALVTFFEEGFFKIPSLRRNIMSTIYVNLVINLLPNVSILAHIGGFVAGGFLAIIFSKKTQNYVRTNFIICLVLLLGGLGYLGYMNRPLDNKYLLTDKYVADILSDFGMKNAAQKIIETAENYRN